MFDNNNYNKRLKFYARELRKESVSRAEKVIWKALLSRKQTGHKFLRQRSIDNFIVDFFCPELKLIIEIDGNSHFRKPEYDFYRQEKLISLVYEILRFNEGAVIHQLDDVSNQIGNAVYVIIGRKKL